MVDFWHVTPTNECKYKRLRRIESIRGHTERQLDGQHAGRFNSQTANVESKEATVRTSAHGVRARCSITAFYASCASWAKSLRVLEILADLSNV